MKKIKLLGLLVVTLVFSACEVHQSVNKDLVTGAYTRENGIGSANVYLEINDEEENRNSFVFGEKIKFMFDDVQGLTRENGMAFPGLSVCVVKNETDTVLFETDLLEGSEEGLEFSPLQLYATFLAIFPNDGSDQYKATLEIWDKKGDGTFLHEMPFTIEKNQVLNINSNGMKYSDIYLWNETKQLVVVNQEVALNDEYILILEGLEGLTPVDEKVFPELTVGMMDGAGDQLLFNPHVLSEINKEGVDFDQFKDDQVFVTITFPSEVRANPCVLKASLTDLKSESRLDIETKLVLK